jgi:hypothetical protein
MYSHDEHRAALKRILAATKLIDEAREELAGVRADLFTDDANSTEDAREHLRAASLLGARMGKACDEAVAALPTPLSRTDTAAAFRALHGGTL